MISCPNGGQIWGGRTSPSLVCMIILWDESKVELVVWCSRGLLSLLSFEKLGCGLVLGVQCVLW